MCAMYHSTQHKDTILPQTVLMAEPMFTVSQYTAQGYSHKLYCINGRTRVSCITGYNTEIVAPNVPVVDVTGSQVCARCQSRYLLMARITVRVPWLHPRARTDGRLRMDT
jgi:hypothetical protein